MKQEEAEQIVHPLDQLEPHTDEWMYKRVKFHGMIQIIKIPSVGLGRPVKRKVKDTKWHADDYSDSGITATVTTAAEAQGEIVWNNDSKKKRSSVSDHRLVGSSSDETSSLKSGKGRRIQSQQ